MHYSKTYALISVAACVSTACNYSATTSSSSTIATSVSIDSANNSEITLSGETGNAMLAGDEISIRNGVVFINGISFGLVPAGAKVKYTKNLKEGVLFVAGERRNAPN